ncbi:phosphatidylserine decarboxylase proenzyme [Bacteroidia bacterium]|nr:phosphatidylserine decarboxylase proenzyme [Bacteroidia bacterium]
MKIHKEGRKIVLYCFVILLLSNAILYYFASKSIFFYFYLLASVVVFGVILNFFRSSRCVFPGETQNLVICPADGTIVAIEEVFEPEYFQENKLQVSVFMGITNVHVNWIPVDGKVLVSTHQNGRFMAAYLPKSSTENERSTIVIERENGDRILVRQIAGAVARRIVTYAQPNQDCRINQEMGFIKFGSRVDLFLPLDAEIQVELDQKVYGNQTIIAQFA